MDRERRRPRRQQRQRQRRCQVFCLFCCQLLYFVLSRFATTCTGGLPLPVCVSVWLGYCLTHTWYNQKHPPTHTSAAHSHRYAVALRWMNEPSESARNLLSKTQLSRRHSSCWFINSNLKHRTHIHTSNQWVTHTLARLYFTFEDQKIQVGEAKHRLHRCANKANCAE